MAIQKCSKCRRAYQAGPCPLGLCADCNSKLLGHKPTIVGPPNDHIDYGVAQLLPGLGPQLGETYRNTHHKTIGTVVKVRRGRQTWVTLRVRGRLTDVAVTVLDAHWKRCRPDGRPVM